MFAFLVTCTLLLSLVSFKNNCPEFWPSEVALLLKCQYRTELPKSNNWSLTTCRRVFHRDQPFDYLNLHGLRSLQY